MSTGEKAKWSSAIERMRARIAQTLSTLRWEFPHGADATTGKWATTVGAT